MIELSDDVIDNLLCKMDAVYYRTVVLHNFIQEYLLNRNDENVETLESVDIRNDKITV